MSEQGFKQRLADDLDARYQKLLEVVDAALESRRKVWVDVACKDCGRKQRVLAEVNDIDAALKASEFMAQHGHGRPGVASPDIDDRVTFLRVTGDVTAALEAAKRLWGEEKAAELRNALAAVK